MLFQTFQEVTRYWGFKIFSKLFKKKELILWI